MAKKRTILGQDPDVLLAMLANLLSWIVSTTFPSYVSSLLPKCDEEETQDEELLNSREKEERARCVAIGRPGGLEQLRVIRLKKGIVTVGYNVTHFCKAPFTPPITESSSIPHDCVIIKNNTFSVNYADCAIRWGLYESAKKFVGYPIVPGFDVAGIIDTVPKNETHFKSGDKVFGVTLFGVSAILATLNRKFANDKKINNNVGKYLSPH